MQEITIYKANQRAKINIFKTLLIVAKNVIASKELILQLYRRDFLMMYKKSFLGIGWLFFAPIMSIVSWLLMNASGVLEPGDVGVPYPVYVLLGMSIWTFFMNLYTSTGQTLQVAQSFIQQVNFHHEILVFKQGLQNLTNFGLSIVLNLIVMLFFKVYPSFHMLLLPLYAIPIFLFAASIGLFISVLKTITTDIEKIAGFITGILMFITPIIYSSDDKVGWLQKINYYNPLTYLVCAPRDLVFYGTYDNMGNYFITVIGSVVLFALSMRFFYVSEKKIIEKMI